MAVNRDHPSESLEFQAERFADHLGKISSFLDENSSVSIESVVLSEAPGKRISGRIAFPRNPLVLFDYRVFLDPESGFLTVDQSTFSVIRGHEGREPLVRWDYIRSPRSNIPCAHIQIHSHGDEWTHALLLSGHDSRRARRRIKNEARTPRIANVHLPVGRSRFRPCLEEILLFVIDEFGAACTPQARDALHRGIREWEKIQLRVAVRHDRAVALEALEE
ncbi:MULTISPECIES: hypothetical protein [Actinotignum]|uniref:Uncharacterized protein n=2 Tax=Actinotignum timonense TaxID=1870995 RepID=A0AAW9HE22_9ACTO|nr:MULTISPECIES: hypothetical protein [Actinotignum]MBS5748929.1 hypothetical protein [Actinotignum schaalii]MDE1559231.1 hypothetical protein [Actinotignum schaalii]MDE1663926.1 hypothetical protein [Actinotignum schaalii]MDK6419405.1 hypothetical protein [Actinotignum timonense]MDK6590686.1 hypothetical protein [Actinotignum timonense]